MTGPAWHEGRAVAFDLETTGVDVHEDRMVTVAIVHLKPNERPRTLTWLIDPGVPIAPEASDVHGWTAERIREHLIDPDAQASCTLNGRTTLSSDRATAVHEIAGQVALAISQRVPLIAFNAAFDLTILEAECRRHQVATLTERLAPRGIAGVVDPFVVDKHYSRRRGPRKLVNQVDHYGVIVAGAHDAGADALAAARVVGKQVAAYPELARMSLSKLHQSQIGWRQEQCDSLRKYFDSKGTPHDGVPGEWPLIPARTQAVAS